MKKAILGLVVIISFLLCISPVIVIGDLDEGIQNNDDCDACQKGSPSQCQQTSGGAEWRTCDCMNQNDPNDCCWSEWIDCPNGANGCLNGHCCHIDTPSNL